MEPLSSVEPPPSSVVPAADGSLMASAMAGDEGSAESSLPCIGSSWTALPTVVMASGQSQSSAVAAAASMVRAGVSASSSSSRAQNRISPRREGQVEMCCGTLLAAEDEVRPASASVSASLARAGVCASSSSIGANEVVGDTASTLSLPRRRGMKRAWKAGVGPDCRPYVAGRVSPLEEALRAYSIRGAGPIIIPRIGLEFDSCEEGFDYYNLYSWEMGFGIRHAAGHSYEKDNKKYRNMVKLVCGCAGTPSAGVKKSIKQGCPAQMRLHRTDDNGWYIHEFVAVHNHPMSATCGEKRCFKSHREIDPHTKEMIRNLRANNVSLTKVYCLLKSYFGANSLSPLSKRALRNVCAQINKETVQDDVQKTVELFNKLHEEDSGFANVVELDNEGKIKNMIWTNGKSRHDYACFGDAVTFDTTYKTNKYNMPFGLFVGVNNHFQSIVFAGVLMRDESIPSFEWVFTQFVSLMGGKAPKTILTDQCRAMEVALANKLPDVTHRWCKWHVFKTIKSELGVKYTKEFKKELNKVCNHTLSPAEFEAAWTDLMVKYELTDNVYMKNIFDNRRLWAKAYFMDKFCAKQTSTQRSESANHVLKTFVPPGASMNVFVEQYHKLLSDWSEKEDQKNHEDKIPIRGSCTGWQFEKHAANFYTRTMLAKFVEHIKQAASYEVVELVPRHMYKLDHIESEAREKWARTSFVVSLEEDGRCFQCECGLWEHMGMLCSHSIRVMMHIMMREVPEHHLLRRWSREGNKADGISLPLVNSGASLRMSRTFRNASLSRKAQELVDCGDLNIECYDMCYQGMCSLLERMKLTYPQADGLGQVAQTTCAGIAQSSGDAASVLDEGGPLQLDAMVPDFTGARGRPSNARDKPGYELRKPLSTRTKRCKTCRATGHGTDRCPERDPATQQPRAPPIGMEP